MLNIPLALQNLRIQQLLQPNIGQPPDDSLAVTGPYNNDPAMPQESNGYNPRTELSSAYSNALQNMPQRQNPGIMRNIFGAMAGLGAGVHPAGISGGQPIGFEGNPDLALQTTDRAANAPYYRKLGDWKTQTDALGKGAAEEDRYNTNERIRTYNEEGRDLKQQQISINQQKADAIDRANEIKEATEANKHEFHMQDLNRKIEKADNDLMIAQKNLELKGKSIENLEAFHKAQLASINARREAQTADDKAKLEQMTRKNDAQIERIKLLNSLPNAGVGGAAQSKETEQTIFNPDGTIAGKKVTRSGPSKEHILTDPISKQQYDTTSWSAGDIAAAKARGWK